MLMIDLVCSQTDTKIAVMGPFSLIAQSHNKVYAEIIQPLQNAGLSSVPILSQSPFFPLFYSVGNGQSNKSS